MQQSHLPIIFQVDEGIIYDVDYFLKRNKLLFTNVLVVSGKSFSYRFAKKVSAKNTWANYVLENNTFEDVENLKKCINNQNIDLIIGVGGGKVIDAVKRASYLSNVNNLSIPTIISNDGLISPVAVIRNRLGKTESLPGMMPMGVVIDLNIIKEAPIEFIRAATGDILSNFSATNDWILALKHDKERMNDIAFHLSRSAAYALLHYDNINLKSKSFLRILVQGLVNSGIAMSLAGTSRPCSGSEHLLSHAIDYLGYSEGALHGTQVASISLFTLFLQGKLSQKHIRYANAIQIPLRFTELLKENSEEILREIFQKSKEMRPGRVTILDQLREDTFIECLEEFLQLDFQQVNLTDHFSKRI